MAVVELEVADDGSIAKMPEAVQKLIDKAFGQGQARATDESSKTLKGLQTEIETLKKGSLGAADREKLRTLEIEKSKADEALATANKDWKLAEEIRDTRHKAELAERDGKLAERQAELDKRTERVRELVAKDISIAALAAGARKESLGELQQLLGTRIGLDDGLQPFVRDEKDPGKAALDKDGKPVTVEGLVTQYLADHSHHKAAASGRGGGAGGGRSLSGNAPPTDKGAAFAEVERAPSVHNVAAAFRHVGKG